MTSADPADRSRRPARERRRGRPLRHSLRRRGSGLRRFARRHAVAIGVTVLSVAVILGGLLGEGFLSPPPGGDTPEPVSLPRPVVVTPRTAPPPGSASAALEVHRVVLRVTAAGPVGQVGYVVPTGERRTSGRRIVTGSTWSLREKAIGTTVAAAVYIQSDSTGHATTCTIRVDGRVVARRTVSSPYARTRCIGAGPRSTGRR